MRLQTISRVGILFSEALASTKEKRKLQELLLREHGICTPSGGKRGIILPLIVSPPQFLSRAVHWTTNARRLSKLFSPEEQEKRARRTVCRTLFRSHIYALPKRISIIASTVTNTAEGREPNYSPNVARSHTRISGATSIRVCFYFSSNCSARREIRILSV